MPNKTNPYKYPIRIDRDGRWFHEGSEIKRPAMVKLFATVLKKDDKGRYWLKTPAEEGLIDVEDVPFVVVDLEIEGEGQQRNVRLITSLGQSVELNDSHKIVMKENIPYIEIKDTLEARISRAVFYKLADLVEHDMPTAPGIQTYGFWSNGVFQDLGNEKNKKIR